jgi:Lrp/AsnC family transcriptional regulator, leucine-responsive regulatory protein
MTEDITVMRLSARGRRAGGILRGHVKASIHPKDWELLAILQSEGKATYADLARRVNLSQTAVHERVKKLEARGLIRGYCAMVDPAALGLPVTAFVFVEQQPGPNGNALPERFAELPEVVACHSIAADETFLLKVRVADNAELERVISQIRSLDGVGRTRCVVGLTTWFEARPVPPPAPPGGGDEPPQTV